MDKKKKKTQLRSRYTNSKILYKNLSCRVSEHDDQRITDYCINNNVSKSLFISSAAVYCADNNIDIDEILSHTLTDDNIDHSIYENDYLY